MNINRTTMTSVVAGAVLVGGGWFATAAQAAPWSGSLGVPVLSTITGDADLTATLQLAREEERMARDLYRALAEKYDAAPFATIAISEQRHFDAVGVLLDRYDVADPSAGKTAGSYADATLQELYGGWLKEGRTSLSAAYDVGVALEQRDVADLEATLAEVDQADVRQVLTMLLAGSRHHLAAFQAAADGETLGLQNGQGRRWGRGSGHGMGYGMGAGMGGRMGFGNGTGSAYGPGDCPMLDADDS